MRIPRLRRKKGGMRYKTEEEEESLIEGFLPSREWTHRRCRSSPPGRYYSSLCIKA